MVTIEKIIAAGLIPILVFFLYLIFVMMPVMAYTEAECLRQGLPKAHVTVWLERYCSNFDGAVTVRVIEQ